MSGFRLGALAAVFSLAALPALAADTPIATATFKSSAQDDIGTADLSEGPEGVLMRVNVEGLTPGWHGIHFHATGDCSDEGFKKSGAHVQHGEKEPHGLLNPEGPDDGDLPNLYVAEDGTGQAEMFSERVTLTGEDDDRAHLLDEDGAAIVIHANADDHMSQPIGGAGDRVACAVIEKVQ
ncbi:superoxide dismutase copper/zinc binding [Parvibaculum lavamentivorans DS-1]|uniref:Superoxide dismutase [Cu-Zn] n=1 Tax=Parvibaculum lavamentivorans (strain DS-1 / DSM 13023 / NCIMB 13966) TaxID=402881 RepID=A7HPB2_PARL1|nr:superoxide dismutase family protein [Parvibaculum lavamentivorans]ABS61745.1 superoxide dismutase copper/zinc binding [Parvibaculum lavamentivorans DS-1]